MRSPRIRGKATPTGTLVRHTAKAPKRSVTWNTTEIAYNSTGSERPPGRAAWRELRAITIRTKRLIHFGDTIEHLSVLFFCKEGEEVRSELFSILIQIATHRLRSHGEEGGLGMAILLCITRQRLSHRKGGIFIEIHQAPQAVHGKTLQLHVNVSTFLYTLQPLDTVAKELHRVRPGDK